MKTAIKKSVSKKSVSKAVKTNLTNKEVFYFELLKNKKMSITTSFNKNKVLLEAKTLNKFKSINNKKDFKKLYNATVISQLEADSRAKNQKKCKNTHYDSVYKFASHLNLLMSYLHEAIRSAK